MILPLALAAAALAAPFAPPLDTAIAYTTTDTRPAGAGVATIRLHQTLRFTRPSAGLQATLIATGQEIDAAEPYRGLMTILFDPFRGVATTVRLDDAGRIIGAIDAAATWATIRAAEQAMVAGLQRDPALSAARKAQTVLLIREAIEAVPPAAQAARLMDAVSALLAPPLPALLPGERRAFTGLLRSPAGMLESRGAVTLVRADGDALVYRIETRTAPDATRPAIEALIARAAGATTPAARARIEANVAALENSAFGERTDLSVERGTGLLRSVRSERFAIDAAGAIRPIDTSETARDRK